MIRLPAFAGEVLREQDQTRLSALADGDWSEREGSVTAWLRAMQAADLLSPEDWSWAMQKPVELSANGLVERGLAAACRRGSPPGWEGLRWTLRLGDDEGLIVAEFGDILSLPELPDHVAPLVRMAMQRASTHLPMTLPLETGFVFDLEWELEAFRDWRATQPSALEKGPLEDWLQEHGEVLEGWYHNGIIDIHDPMNDFDALLTAYRAWRPGGAPPTNAVLRAAFLDLLCGHPGDPWLAPLARLLGVLMGQKPTLGQLPMAAPVGYELGEPSVALFVDEPLAHHAQVALRDDYWQMLGEIGELPGWGFDPCDAAATFASLGPMARAGRALYRFVNEVKRLR